MNTKTKTKLRQYAENGVCPACGSKDIDWQGSEVDGDQLYYMATCEDCEYSWREWHNLIFAGIVGDDGQELEPRAVPA